MHELLKAIVAKLDRIEEKQDRLADTLNNHKQQDERRLTSLEVKSKWSQRQFGAIYISALAVMGWLVTYITGGR